VKHRFDILDIIQRRDGRNITIGHVVAYGDNESEFFLGYDGKRKTKQ
jgi:hypothetical protein